MEKIKLVIVDDHSLIINGYKNIFSNFPNLEIIGETNNGKDAITLIQSVSPDIVLMDINLPFKNGIDCVKELKQLDCTSKFIFITMHHEEIYVLKAVKAGASGYILKDTEIEELISLIERIHYTDTFHYSDKLNIDIKKKLNNPSLFSEFDEKFNLTSREIDVIKLLSLGLNNKEISEKLFISDRTVNTHRTNIMFKMNTKNAVELVVKALELKLI
jgi:two-component system, NarL family, response regulator DegU